MEFSEIAAGLPHIMSEALGQPVTVIDIDRPPPAAHEEQPWLAAKYGPAGDDDLHGVTPLTVTAGERALDLVVKVNPVHGIGETLIPWICDTYDVDLPAPYATFHSTREVVGTGAREANVYDLSIQMPELMTILPPYYGTIMADSERAVVLGDVGPLAGLDAGGRIDHWSPDHIDAALRGIAAVHAASAPIAAEVPWLPPRTDTATIAGDASLWRALLADAAARLPDIVTPDVVARRTQLIDTVAVWHPAKDAMPTVITHNDFNQRNVGFDADGRVIALDWELTRRDSPQRDVAELLTFLLDDNATAEQLLHHAETHRTALGATGMSLDREAYLAALAADLRCEAIDRVGMQLLLEAAFDLPYVPRVNRTVDHLVRLSEPWLA